MKTEHDRAMGIVMWLPLSFACIGTMLMAIGGFEITAMGQEDPLSFNLGVGFMIIALALFSVWCFIGLALLYIDKKS